MDEIKKEIESILYKYLTITNIDRLTIDESKYREFLDAVLQYILDVKYADLIAFLDKAIIDSKQNIEKYSKELLGLYFSDNFKSYTKFISNEKQKIIFWYNDTCLYKYTSLYPMHALREYKDNILIFYRNKKSDNQPLATIVSRSGEELFTIDYPTKEDSECVNENISYYGATVDEINATIQCIFTNGNCRLDFWCKYDLSQKKYTDSNFSK